MGATNRLRALVVDDMQVNRLILGKLLQSFGFDVFYSKDGQEAYEFYKEQGTDISCVWMDINMPGMDGLEASRHIRSIEAAQLSNGKMTSNGSEDSLSSSYPEEQVVPDTVARSTRSSSTAPIRRVPIVGVSACSLTEQLKSSALDGIPITEDTDKPWELCGMDLFVEKPINRSKLECVLDQLQDQLGMQSSDCSSSEPLQTPPSPQEPDWASCCGPLPVTDFMVSSCKDDGQVLKRTLEATALAEKKRKLAEALS